MTERSSEHGGYMQRWMERRRRGASRLKYMVRRVRGCEGGGWGACLEYINMVLMDWLQSIGGILSWIRARIKQ